MANDEQQRRELVSPAEDSAVRRAVIEWLNSYDEKPQRVDYEFLGKTAGLCIAVVQSAYKTKQFINGGYQAQFQFQIVYRLIADDIDGRLDADETLNSMGAWMEENVPAPPTGIDFWKIKRDTAAAVMARYDNNAEDHSISMTINYEVF